MHTKVIWSIKNSWTPFLLSKSTLHASATPRACKTCDESATKVDLYTQLLLCTPHFLSDNLALRSLTLPLHLIRFTEHTTYGIQQSLPAVVAAATSTALSWDVGSAGSGMHAESAGQGFCLCFSHRRRVSPQSAATSPRRVPRGRGRAPPGALGRRLPSRQRVTGRASALSQRRPRR